MIVTTKAPAPIKAPVKVTETTYAMWYAKPVNLGHIQNKGGVWVTEDGYKFISSREALEYLATLHDRGFKATTAPDDLKDMAYNDIVKLRMNKKKHPRVRKSKDNMVKLPDGMSLDDLKQLIELAEKLKLPVANKLAVTDFTAKKQAKEKKNDALANVRK